MATYCKEVSHTFSEYLLIPRYSSIECIPDNINMKTPIVKFKKDEVPILTMNIPVVSAIMQSVSNDTMAVELAKEGGVSFIYCSQPIKQQAEMVKRAKNYKAGFVTSDTNIGPDQTLEDILVLKKRTGHSTTAVTDDGTPHGKLIGIVTSKNYRISRLDKSIKVRDMTPIEKVIYAKEGITLNEANDILWNNKLNSLPIVDNNQRIVAFVFRKDYDLHKENPLELLDSSKRYVVGAGINTRDYAEIVPALVEAGADILCIDSSDGLQNGKSLHWILYAENMVITLKLVQEI